MVRSKIATYMERTFLFEFDEDVGDNTDLFKAGIIDSHGYIQLMRFIQDTFGVRFSRNELLSAVITSLSGMVAVVEEKIALGERADVGTSAAGVRHDEST